MEGNVYSSAKIGPLKFFDLLMVVIQDKQTGHAMSVNIVIIHLLHS